MNYIYKYKKILITTAFIYSNGSLHLGHIYENVQADIFYKYNKLIKNKIFFISSDDSHGTPVLLKFNNLNKKINFLIKNVKNDHIKKFKNYSIYHDYYNTTHNKINNITLLKIFRLLKYKKLIFNKKIYQFYDKNKKVFLSDRMIIGDCPRCSEKKQYADNCIKCNYVFNSTEIINPISILSNTKPIIKKSNDYFINFNGYNKILFKIIKKDINIEKSVFNKSKEWLNNKKLENWNISRNKPYFGFKIPNTNKYFYVWLDALICYISSTIKLSKNNKKLYIKYWKKKSEYELHQFIGKDIIYFHTIFWPFILYNLNFRQPTKIIVHGHLTINKKKISKSNKDKLQNFNNIYSDYIRYYFSYKSSNNIKDINFDLNELNKLINNNIINNLLNLMSRSCTLINKFCNNKLSNKLLDNSPYNFFLNYVETIWYLYSNLNYKKIINITNKLINIGNLFINNNKPWKYKNNIDKIRNISSVGINLFKIIIIYISPIIPKISLYSEKILNFKINKENIFNKFKEGHIINNFYIKYKRINYY